MADSLVINITAGKQQDAAIDHGCNFLRLEQTDITSADSPANLSDVNAMMMMAASGLSATAYRKESCPLRVIDEDTIEFDLGFYVWPGPIDLAYSLSAVIGTIDTGKRIEQDRSLEAVAEMSRTADLDGVYTGDVQPLTPAINSEGEDIDNPYTMEGCRIVQDKDTFRVFRITGRRHGFLHLLTISIAGVAENKISNLRPKVIARWLDPAGKAKSAALELTVPQCILDALDTCPDAGGGESSHIVDTSARVYYSTCDGSVLGVRYDHQ